MTTEPNRDDFELLQEHYDGAVAVRDKISWSGDYPDYPYAVTALMRYITSSPWCNHEYQPTATNGILARLDTADLLEVRSVLTSISRGERFTAGSWRTALHDGHLSAVIERAENLTEA